MSRQHVDHGDLVQFAQEKVNLPQDKASIYRAQARRLREKLEGYLSDHPDFSLKKIMLSGNLVKESRPQEFEQRYKWISLPKSGILMPRKKRSLS